LNLLLQRNCFRPESATNHNRSTDSIEGKQQSVYDQTMQDSAEVVSPLPYVTGSPVIALEPNVVVKLVNNGVDGTTEGNMTLVNKLEHSRVCYKIKTTAPKDYIVRPSSGIIEAGGSEKIHLSCTKADSEKSDRFMIQSFAEPIGAGYTTPLPRDLWQHNRKCYHDQRILVELSQPVSIEKESEGQEEIAMNHEFQVDDMSPIPSETATLKSAMPIAPNASAFDETTVDNVNKISCSVKAPSTSSAGGIPSGGSAVANIGGVHQTAAAHKTSQRAGDTSSGTAAEPIPVSTPYHPRSNVAEDEILFTPLQVIFLIVGCIALLKILRIL